MATVQQIESPSDAMPQADCDRMMTRLGSFQIEKAMWHVSESDHPLRYPWRDPHCALAYRVLDALRVLAALEEMH